MCVCEFSSGREGVRVGVGLRREGEKRRGDVSCIKWKWEVEPN